MKHGSFDAILWCPDEWQAFDSVLSNAVSAEIARQREGLELIASENYVSTRVMQACGSVFTNKYAEGYPNKRYYGGCVNYDTVESHAISLAKQIFAAEWANVQPHSGANANLAAYYGLLKPGDTILSMNLSHGGHLTHGSPVSISGTWLNVVHYGLNEKHLIDFDDIRNLAQTHKPKLIVCGATCYPRIIDFGAFADIARSVGAYLVADIAHIAGLVAAGAHPSPIPHCDVVTSTTHKTLRGPRGGLIMGRDPEMGKRMDKAIFPGTQGGPLMHQVLGKAVCFREALSPDFKTYAAQVIKNAQALAGGLMEAGIDVITGGTDNHLVWISLLNQKDLDGKTAEKLLESAGITVNKNTIPGDPRSPFVTSGIRMGAAACTTRGLGPTHMAQIAEWTGEILRTQDDGVIEKVRQKVKQLCLDFPIYSA